MLLLSGFNPPRRCCLPLVVSPLIWSWKGECCQDSNNVMIMGPEEKANTFFFFGWLFFLFLAFFVCLFVLRQAHSSSWSDKVKSVMQKWKRLPGQRRLQAAWIPTPFCLPPSVWTGKSGAKFLQNSCWIGSVFCPDKSAGQEQEAAL